MDVPDGRRKLHATPTPQVGGLAVSAPLLFVLGVLGGATDFVPLYVSLMAAVAIFLVVGLLDNFGKVFFPEFALFTIFVPMALILAVRPTGLFGRE